MKLLRHTFYTKTPLSEISLFFRNCKKFYIYLRVYSHSPEILLKENQIFFTAQKWGEAIKLWGFVISCSIFRKYFQSKSSVMQDQLKSIL